MAEKKITKRENFENIKAYLEANGKTEWAEVMAHEIDLISRKNSKSAKLTPAQNDAIAIAEIIKDILASCEDKRGMTVTALLKEEPIKAYVRYNGEGVSSQVITAIFTKNSKDYVRTVEKKVAYYSLAYGVEEDTEVEGE
jgi:hypothetical protein